MQGRIIRRRWPRTVILSLVLVQLFVDVQPGLQVERDGLLREGHVVVTAASARTARARHHRGPSPVENLQLQAVPQGDVVATAEMDAEALRVVASLARHRFRESAVAMMRDGGRREPVFCGNDTCHFDVIPRKVRYVVHRHVPSDVTMKSFADRITAIRELPGPYDHLFPVRGVPNFFITPSGAFRVLEFTAGEWRVRTISGDPLPDTDWQPIDTWVDSP